MDLQMPYLTETKLKQEELEKMIFLVFIKIERKTHPSERGWDMSDH